MMSTLPPVVIDYGTDQIKAGVAGQLQPSHVFKNVIARSLLTGEDEVYFGDAAWKKRDTLSVLRHMERGRVVSWDDMEMAMNNVLHTQLQISTSEQQVLLTEFPLRPSTDRRKICSIMFESLEVSGLYLASQSVLALLASGRVSGCVLDCGFDVTHAVPVIEGYCLPHAVRQLGLGGRDVTANLAELLKMSGSAQFSSPSQQHDSMQDIKEQLGYVSADPSKESPLTLDSAVVDYQLPDGKTIRLGSERCQAPEILFSPHTVGVVGPGISALLVSSVLNSDVDLQGVMLNNCVLAGGSRLFPGMGRRLREEVSALLNPQKGNCVGPVPLADSAWLGGSLLASLPSFIDMSINVAEYQEFGSNVVHHKCF